MKYLLYLRRSIFRRPQRHFTLYSILTCAFLLPLVISIYRDSSAYGEKQYLLEWSKGSTFHISNATEADVPYFEDMDGMSQPLYEDNTIYLRILSDDEWKNFRLVDDYARRVMDQMALTGNSHLAMTPFDYFLAHGISTDPAAETGQKALLMVNIFIILISVCVARSAYKSHLNRFSSEVGTLISCGADHRQIRHIFVIEFLAVFSLAAISSILISIGIMKLLLGVFLEIKDISGLAWVIFHINPVNILLHLLIYLVSSAAVLGISLLQYSKGSTWSLLHNHAVVKKSALRKGIDIAPPPSAALSRLWRRRTNRSLRGCLLISVPIMTIFLFLFNYLALDIDVMTKAPEYELQVNKSGEFSEEDIAYVENIPGVAQVLPHREEISSYFEEPDIYSTLNILLVQPDLHSQVEGALQERFLKGEYRIVDHQAPVDYMEAISGGIFLLLAYIFCILFLFILILLCIKLCDYIENCRSTIGSLYVIGASRRDLYRSYIRQIMPTAIAAAIIPIIISEILSVLVAASVNATAVINGMVIIVYIAVAAAVLGAYILPSHCALKNILRRL